MLLKQGKLVAGYELKIGEIEKAEAEKVVWKISAGIPKAGLVSLRRSLRLRTKASPQKT